MTRCLTLALLLAASSTAIAAEQSYLAGVPPKTAKLNEVVSFKPAGDWHFNLNAPQDCGSGPALDVKPLALKCQFSSGGEQLVLLNICDKSGKTCVTEEFTVKVQGRPAAKRALPAEAASGPGLEGFLLNAPAAALAQAKKEKKLLFIDFFGKWCPPCRLMEDTVLEKPEFLEASSGMVRVGLDIDLPLAREWLAHFKVRSYPTYLVADTQLREIGRQAGSQDLLPFVTWVKKQQSWKSSPLAAAKASASSLDEAGRLRVAEAYLSEEKWAEAAALLKGIPSRYAAYLAAYAEFKKRAAAGEKDLASLYKGLIERFDGRDGQDAMGSVPDWVAELHKLDPDAAKPYLDDLDGLAARLAASKEAAAEGVAGPSIPLTLAYALHKAGLGERAKEYFLKTAAAYGALAEGAGSPERAKGLRMMQCRYLGQVEKYEEMAAIYAGLVEKFPSEYAFHRSYASVLLKLGKHQEALNEAVLAAGLSYGDIRLQILRLKAEIELARKDKAAAVKTLREALAEADLPKDRTLGTHGAYRGLKDSLAKVEASN